MRIQVYGPGCARCKQLEASTRDALAAMGEAAAVVEKVEDINSIAEAGVMRTPALAIDGRLVLQGRVPGVPELTSILTKAMARATGVDHR